jgi:hypothetical protein
VLDGRGKGEGVAAALKNVSEMQIFGFERLP